MIHLFNALIIGLLLFNLTAIGLAATKLSHLPYGLAKSAAVILGCAVFFFIEHYSYLGSLAWLAPVSTVGSAYVIWKGRLLLWQNRWAEAIFLIGFGYTLFWRYLDPDGYSAVEKLADLNFISSYMFGDKLPPADLWLHPYELTQYYSFQHYAAALLGRILSIAPGVTYNLSYCLIVALALPPVLEFVRAFTTNRANQIIVMLAFTLGGTGASLVTPFLVKHVHTKEVYIHERHFASMRFIGGTDAEPTSTLSPLGIKLQNLIYGSPEENTPVPGVDKVIRYPRLANGELDHEKITELPVEIFSYLIQLGDYHPPLAGYLALTLGLGAFGVLLRLGSDRLQERCAWGVLAGTVPFTVVANTWSFPFQGFFLVFCIGFMWRYRRPPEWPILAGTIAIPWILFLPFISYFLAKSVGSGLSPKLVGADQHAPLIPYLLQMWPVLTMTVLGWFAPSKEQREYRWFVVFIAVSLVIIEVINVDDIYAGRFDRFNTSLKWWPWVASMSFLLLGPMCLAAPKNKVVVRMGALVVLMASLAYVRVLALEWWDAPKKLAGKLDGMTWLRNLNEEVDRSGLSTTSINSTILNYLLANREGVILERPSPDDRMAFINTGAYAVYTGHPAVFGWPGHQQLWRGYQKDVQTRWDQARAFFTAKLLNPLDFLRVNEVKYIVWPGAERLSPENVAIFDIIKGQIAEDYDFMKIDPYDERRGIFVRKEK